MWRRVILMFVAGFLVLAVPSVGSAKPQPSAKKKKRSDKSKSKSKKKRTSVNRFDNQQTLRLGLVVAGNLAIDDGVGVSVDYDVPVLQNLGPGTLYLAPSGLAVFGSNRDESQTVIGATASARYVLQTHPVLQPWVRAGAGGYWFRYKEEIAGEDRVETAFGPGFAFGLGVDLRLKTGQLITAAVESHRAEDDFFSVNLGVGFHF